MMRCFQYFSREHLTLLKLSLFLISAISLCSCVLEPEDPPKDIYSMKEMLGRWTDPDGTPGNFIEFKLVKKEDLPVTEGVVLVEDFFGMKEAEGSWNYGAWQPLEINLLAKPTGGIEKNGGDDHASDLQLDKILILKARNHKTLLLSEFEAKEVRSGRVKTRLLPESLALTRVSEADYVPEFL